MFDVHSSVSLLVLSWCCGPQHQVQVLRLHRRLLGLLPRPQDRRVSQHAGVRGRGSEGPPPTQGRESQRQPREGLHRPRECLKGSPTRLIYLVLINISFSYKNVTLKILNCLVFINVEKFISLERRHCCLHSGWWRQLSCSGVVSAPYSGTFTLSSDQPFQFEPERNDSWSR